MSRYKIAVNLELTSKCNAKCIMCPRDAIPVPALMTTETVDRVLDRITPDDVFRVVTAGYGEPTTHPKFIDYANKVRAHPVRFDMATNGERLDDEGKLAAIDGAFQVMILSFSSIDPKVYGVVHANLDHERVMRNIELAARTLKQTSLVISLTCMPDCLDTLPETIEWLQSLEEDMVLSMSPTLYNRAGTFNEASVETKTLRHIIDKYGLHSQDLDFIASIGNFLGQHFSNKFKCPPRNVDVLVSAQGEYMYCFNDISHSHSLGHVDAMTLRQAIEKREKTGPDPAICDDCSMRGRYGLGEMAKVGISYLKSKVA